MPSLPSFPKFQNLEAICNALQKQILSANYKFNSFDRIGRTVQNTPPANQPYFGLVNWKLSQVENQAQGLEKWLMHFMVLIYIRADASQGTQPGTLLNAALVAVVAAMRSGATYERQTLGGLVDNAWIEGEILLATGITDEAQLALMIPVVVDLGL